jgi:hypothetical protein
VVNDSVIQVYKARKFDPGEHRAPSKLKDLTYLKLPDNEEKILQDCLL